MKITHTEAQAKQEADRKPLPGGKHRGTITEASDGRSKRDNEKIDLLVVVIDAHGNEHRLWDSLTDTPKGSLRLRHAAAAVGALDDEGGEITAQQFVGRDVIVTTAIERKRGYPPRAVIVDYAPAAADESRIVNLRAAGG